MDNFKIGKNLDLYVEQQNTLKFPRLKPNILLRFLYIFFDCIYGKKRTLAKFLVLGVLARYPYWAWEIGSYKALSRFYSRPNPPDETQIAEMLHVISIGRESQDNEACHMMLLADIIRHKEIFLNWFKHSLVLRVLAFNYYFLNRILYFLNPTASFYMNAAFESHAEHEYMRLAEEHPEWEAEAVNSAYFKYYPKQKSLSDLLRRIALDERDQMNQSIKAATRISNQINKKP
jgi:ubiquinol oxidase